MCPQLPLNTHPSSHIYWFSLKPKERVPGWSVVLDRGQVSFIFISGCKKPPEVKACVVERAFAVLSLFLIHIAKTKLHSEKLTL